MRITGWVLVGLFSLSSWGFAQSAQPSRTADSSTSASVRTSSGATTGALSRESLKQQARTRLTQIETQISELVGRASMTGGEGRAQLSQVMSAFTSNALSAYYGGRYEDCCKVLEGLQKQIDETSNTLSRQASK